MSGFSSLWNIGPAITGQTIGSAYQQYRGPTSGMAIGTIMAWITADDKGKAAKPFVFGKPVGASFHDPTLTQVGDYLVGAQGTFFIASQDVPAPIQVVQCNRVVSFARPDANATPTAPTAPTYGEQPSYSTSSEAAAAPLMTDWPASILQGTKGERNPTGLPDNTREPWFSVLVPALAGVVLQNDDLMSDDLGRNYVLSSCELSALGWRLTTTLASA